MMRLDRDHKAPPDGGGRIGRGRLEFRDLEFAYRGQQTKALDGVSIRIAPGERVGIVGRVASGKSTLGKLLCGLYAADKGAVIVDGTDVRHCWMADLRKAVAYVGQEPELFRGHAAGKTSCSAGKTTTRRSRKPRMPRASPRSRKAIRSAMR